MIVKFDDSGIKVEGLGEHLVFTDDLVVGEYGGRQNGKTLRMLNPLPVRQVINKGATILFWADGDKTIVRRSKDDKFDKTKGFLWAYFLKHCGMSRTKANKFLENLEVEDK